MERKAILMSGSVSNDCEGAKLRRTREFVRETVKRMLDKDIGLVVLADKEPVMLLGEEELPQIWDWEVLRAVEEYLPENSSKPQGPLAKAIMRTDYIDGRVANQNADLIRHLQEQGALEIAPIDPALYSGRSIRKKTTKHAAGMIAISGGKGTYQAAEIMLKAGKPVMAGDVDLGGITDDHYGGPELFKEMQANQEHFLPKTHLKVNGQLTT